MAVKKSWIAEKSCIAGKQSRIANKSWNESRMLTKAIINLSAILHFSGKLWDFMTYVWVLNNYTYLYICYTICMVIATFNILICLLMSQVEDVLDQSSSVETNHQHYHHHLQFVAGHDNWLYVFSWMFDDPVL